MHSGLNCSDYCEGVWYCRSRGSSLMAWWWKCTIHNFGRMKKETFSRTGLETIVRLMQSWFP